MKNRSLFTYSMKVYILSLLGFFILVSCGEKGLQRLSEPDWIHRDSGTFMNSRQKSFYGVGLVIGVKNKPEARTAAEERARAEVSKIFGTYTRLLMLNYSASTTARTIRGRNGVQNMEKSLKTFSEMTLKDVTIMDHWSDPSENTYSTLARLDLERFREQINEAKELNASVRDFLKENAEKVFEQLEAEGTNRR